jgi:hypothetical protein
LLLVAGFLGAWATGMLGRAYEPGELRDRLGIGGESPRSPPANARPAPAGDGQEHPDRPSPRPLSDRNSNLLMPIPHSGDLEMQPWSGRYELIEPETLATQRERLVGRAVAARFVGKPLLDDRGEVLWELPPDGAVTARLVPADAEAQRLLTVLMAEPLLLEVELAGLMEEDLSRGRMVLRVGVISILHAWGGRDDSLQAATRRLLNQRLVLNPQYIAQAIASRSGN